MTVRVTREAEPQIELYGAYEGAVVSSGENMLASLTFTPTDDYLILVPKNAVNYPQLEEASTPSSYIPTSGSSVTRAADTSGLTIDSSIVPWPTPTVIGDELVTNGTFDTDSDWTKGTGWTIGGGVASSDGTQTTRSSLFQGTLVLGKLCQFSITVSNYTAGNVRLRNGIGAGEVYISDKSTNGTFTGIYLVGSSGGNTTLVVDADADFVGSIDNVSVKEIDPLAVAIQVSGRMTYADRGVYTEVIFANWSLDASNFVQPKLDTYGVNTGTYYAFARAGGTNLGDRGEAADYSPGLNVPFNVAAIYTSIKHQAGNEGIASSTPNTTPTALLDLSGTDLQIAYDFMGNVKQVRVWAVDIGDTGIAEASA